VLPQLDEGAVRDTIDAVFAAAEFNRAQAPPLFVRFISWLGDRIAELRQLAAQSPVLYYLLIGTAAAVVLAVVLRALWLAQLRREGRLPGLVPPRTGGRAAGDPWLLAQRAAAAGDFTTAAHHLYAAIIEAAARRGAVRPHPSKTIGDYVREARARASSALLAPFRDFARAYEVVIYGSGHCDRDRYERLRALATAIVGHDA
jgi:hypothetical protein